MFYLFRLFPIKKKVVATCFKGQKYGDNPQFLLEELHKIDHKIDIVWLKDPGQTYDVPDWIRVSFYNLRVKTIYELSTAKVWIDTHRLRTQIRKRKGQVFIETWHGGLGIKRIEGDVEEFRNLKWLMDEVLHTNRLANVFISQSDHLTNIYRRAFGYTGPVYKSGYPKNDILFTDKREVFLKIRSNFELPKDIKLFMYAPSFRDYFYQGINTDVYDVDFVRVKTALERRFGGQWGVIVRWHPLFAQQLNEKMGDLPVINATSYPDMQELILSVDAMLSDYSSCLFDGALREIPCFTYAKDFDKYKEERGVYFEMDELPFPYAKNNDELISNILNYNHDDYIEKWKQFTIRTGLHETGHATEDIANKIIDILNGKKVVWE